MRSLDNRRSGLLGISGLSGDMRRLHEAAVGNPDKNDAQVRADICAGLAWTGVGLDEACNRSTTHAVSDDASRCRVLVLGSQEDEQIARHAWALLA